MDNKKKASLLKLKGVSERLYSSRVLSNAGLVQVRLPAEPEGIIPVFKDARIMHIQFDRTVHHTLPSGEGVGWRAVLAEPPARVTAHHGRAWGQLQKTRYAEKIPHRLYQARFKPWEFNSPSFCNA